MSKTKPTSMEDIGIYRVRRSELGKPEEELTYRQVAQLDPETGAWADWSNEQFVDDAMAELDEDREVASYDLEELLEAFRRGCDTTGTLVLPVDEVPGDVRNPQKNSEGADQESQ